MIRVVLTFLVRKRWVFIDSWSESVPFSSQNVVGFRESFSVERGKPVKSFVCSQGFLGSNETGCRFPSFFSGGIVLPFD